ncbi:COG2043 family uncharacterized protein [Anaerobacterium chartisolvens]|uniref:COG2043 family uncharacterized protein n=1 Tax=Anaerobacterium chartisolvens TaxID=1297424 RepID=A0A369B427_9FIRM|nr:DUF169 domain-containing protein [Anaerobacterium chartisolvens]RCX16299.1 COG2043 family uncharacterized protein [Anaerobacterium chartisolvens]
MNSAVSNYAELIEMLGPCKHPLAAYYTDTRPEKAIGPKGGFCIECDDISEITSGKVKVVDADKHKCAFSFLVRTLKNGMPSAFDAENFGCAGCKFAFGFSERLCGFNHHYLSTGVPGFNKGERYIKRPEDAVRFFSKPLEGRVPKGKYLVFDRMDNVIDKNIEPDVVVFFVNPEVLAGLVTLARFSSDSENLLETHFAAGCASIFAWPMMNIQKGRESAEIGFYDLTGRPFLEPKEMTFTAPYPLFLKMLASFKESFMTVEPEKNGPPNWWSIAKKRSKGAKTSLMMQVMTFIKGKFGNKK